jgi:hypothetical protein
VGLSGFHGAKTEASLLKTLSIACSIIFLFIIGKGSERKGIIAL